MTNVIVIPARLASQRLSRKLLRDETGWPLIRHVYELCLEVPDVDEVIVAADGEEIAEVVRGFGGEVAITPAELPTGTDRVAEACRSLSLSADDLVINVQGDEPDLDPEHVALLLRLLQEHPTCQVATLALTRAGPDSAEDFRNPNRVKLLIDSSGRAQVFTRKAVPESPEGTVPEGGWLQHIGVYGFRSKALERFRTLPRGDLEQQERLEQLRLLEAGCEIRVVEVDVAASGIDTEEDYRRFVENTRRMREDRGDENTAGSVPAEAVDRGEMDDNS
ncbi:MAG: 3-deoxy-manno-octulosonate cytidylyltransferase [Planctomycetota bacterium]|nr:3-deoxy-manno-octulosonate cytidylyltransferase [Planctomycetota bacterium]